jgi:hypothetical protein
MNITFPNSRGAPVWGNNGTSAKQIHQLPLETLREIFMYCMMGSTGDLDSAKVPLLFRRVSHTWQALADSIPGLWSSIVLTPSQFLPNNVQVVKEWLERSGTTKPLSVTLHAPPSPDRSLFLAILAELTPYCRRWKRLCLHVPVQYLPYVLSNSNVPLPSLEYLLLCVNVQPRLIIDSSATRLHSVHLVVYPPLLQPQANIFYLAWRQITFLNIQIVAGTMEAIWDIFLQCPQLLKLIVSATNNASIPRIPFHRGHLLHSNLQHLTVSVNARAGVIGYFLDGLFLPDLRELCLHFIDLADEPCVWPGDAIISLRDRCLPPLLKVAIAGKVIDEADLVDFIRRMKYLQHLSVSYGPQSLVTPAARALVSQNNISIKDCRMAYDAEVETARLHGTAV